MQAFSLLVACLALGACSEEALPPLVATGITVTTPVPGSSMSAGYLMLSNNTDHEIRVTRVTSPQFSAVEIHESLLENGIAKMRRVNTLRIPAGSTIGLQRGGTHLMLMRPTGDLDTVYLNFYDDDSLLLGVHSLLAQEHK
jgi:copper(I)-binding protein